MLAGIRSEHAQTTKPGEPGFVYTMDE